MGPVTSKRRPWTVMVYMAGDNGKIFDTEHGKLRLMAEMTSAGYRDLAEMGSVGTTDNVALVCLFDTQEKSYLIEVRQGQGFDGSVVSPIREVNTGDPAVLRDFIVRSVTTYPADRYALVIWNHGTGWLDTDAYAVVSPAVSLRGVERKIEGCATPSASARTTAYASVSSQPVP